MDKNKVIIFSSPSGGGKSTVISHALKSFPQLKFSISATSRAPRGQEKDGVEYYFVDKEHFRQMVAQDRFVEYEEVYGGSMYGTLKSEVERIWAQGNPIIFDVDVKGGVNLKKYFGSKALSIFIKAPSLEVLEQRLRSRGTDSENAIEARLAKAASEIEYAIGKFDCTIINDKLEDTLSVADRVIGEFLAK